MTDFTQDLYDELLPKLKTMDEEYDPDSLSDCRLVPIQIAIEQIKMKLKTAHFESEEDEIRYFKSVLPPVLALHVYYSEKTEWDRIRHQGSDKSRYEFYDSTYSKVEKFRNDHKDFYQYYRTSQSYYDQMYFARGNSNRSEGPVSIRLIIDPATPPHHCEILATIQGYNRLEQELHRSVKENNASNSQESDVPLRWTLPKINLIELIYALNEVDAFDHGKHELAEIQEYFEKVFDIRLGNITRSFQEILSRKKGHTVFLDQLKEIFIVKVRHTDELNRKLNIRKSQAGDPLL